MQMDKKEKPKDNKEEKKPELPKFGFNPKSFRGGQSFKPNSVKPGGFNPGSFKTQHKG